MSKLKKCLSIIDILSRRGLEKPRYFDPRGQATLTPSGKISLTLFDKIKMPPDN